MIFFWVLIIPNCPPYPDSSILGHKKPVLATLAKLSYLWWVFIFVQVACVSEWSSHTSLPPLSHSAFMIRLLALRVSMDLGKFLERGYLCPVFLAIVSTVCIIITKSLVFGEGVQLISITFIKRFFLISSQY